MFLSVGYCWRRRRDDAVWQNVIPYIFFQTFRCTSFPRLLPRNMQSSSPLRSSRLVSPFSSIKLHTIVSSPPLSWGLEKSQLSIGILAEVILHPLRDTGWYWRNSMGATSFSSLHQETHSISTLRKSFVSCHGIDRGWKDNVEDMEVDKYSEMECLSQ